MSKIRDLFCLNYLVTLISSLHGSDGSLKSLGVDGKESEKELKAKQNPIVVVVVDVDGASPMFDLANCCTN